MKNFFTQLSAVIGKAEIQLNIKTKGEQLTVMLTPKTSANDPALANLQPLFVTGTPAQLDEDFLDAIAKPLQKAVGLIANIEDFEVGTKKAEEESKIKKAEADKIKKEEEEKKKKYDQLVKKADDFLSAGKEKEALGALIQASKSTTQDEKLNKRIKELEAKLSQNSLFDISKPDTTDYLKDDDSIHSIERSRITS